MKTLWILSLLIMTSCGPDFKAGDCITEFDAESWDNNSIAKILEVGNKRYRITYMKPDFMSGEVYSFDNISQVDTIMHKVECPK